MPGDRENDRILKIALSPEDWTSFGLSGLQPSPLVANGPYPCHKGLKATSPWEEYTCRKAEDVRKAEHRLYTAGKDPQIGPHSDIYYRSGLISGEANK